MSARFHPLKILDVCRETADAICLTLKPTPAQAAQFSFLPGQHLVFRAEIDGEDIRRNYSICSAPGAPLRVAIKRIAGGRFSHWAMNQLKPGMTIEAMTPRGHFAWAFEPSSARNYLCFAAGSGITPILALIAAGLAAEPDSRFTLLYGNRSSSSIMFLEELASLKDRYLPRIQVYHFLTAEADDIELFNGRLDPARIAAILRGLIDPSTIDAAFVCGPAAMMEAAEQAMLNAALPPDHVLVERFTAQRNGLVDEQMERAAAKRAEGLTMQITIDGRRRSVEFTADKGSILDSAREAGLPAPFACKAGVCATCRAKLVEGEVRMKANYGLSAEEVALGYVLTCQAVPLGEGVILDYDA